MELAVRSGPDMAVKRKYPSQTHGEMQETRVRRRVCRILKEVKTECGDSNVSSDDDGESRPPVQATSCSLVTLLSHWFWCCCFRHGVLAEIPVPALSHAHRRSQGGAQSLHPGHEDYRLAPPAFRHPLSHPLRQLTHRFMCCRTFPFTARHFGLKASAQ